MRSLPPRLAIIAARLMLCLALLALAWPWPGSTAARATAAAPLLIDINPGSASSYPSDFLQVGGLAYFFANDGVHGRGLWRTDGTQAGTALVRDLSDIPSLLSASAMIEVNGTLFFLVYTGEPTAGGGVSLWRSDGTPAGTTLVEQVHTWSYFRNCSVRIDPFGKNIAITRGERNQWWCGGSFTVHSGGAGGTLFTKLGKSTRIATLDGRSYIFLTYHEDSLPSGLWVSADTPAGITFVEPLPTDGRLEMQGAGDSFFYFASMEYKNTNNSYETPTLWKSTGAPGGATPVREFPENHLIRASAALSDSLIFMSQELWSSDGSAAGTRTLRPAGADVPLSWFTEQVIRFGDHVAFEGPSDCTRPGSSFPTLWVSDGTTAGTRMVRPGLWLVNYWPITRFGDKIVFFAGAANYGAEPWISDGTAAGTRMLAELTPGPDSPISYDLGTLPDKILVSADDGASGRELWVLDPDAPPPAPAPAAGKHHLYLPLAASAPPCTMP